MLDARKRIIMVVDDERSVLDVIREFLESEGFTLLALEKGIQAIELASKISIDLLLTDVFLPTISARVMANRIALVQPRLKVLFMSGYSMETVTSHGLLPMGSEVLQKPIAKRDLIRQVYASLNSGTYWSQISRGSQAGPIASAVEEMPGPWQVENDGPSQ